MGTLTRVNPFFSYETKGRRTLERRLWEMNFRKFSTSQMGTYKYLPYLDGHHPLPAQPQGCPAQN